MGGDGGVVATNRRYMRGAGTADHTGDRSKHAAQKFNATEAMTTCSLTKAPLFQSSGGNGNGSASSTTISTPGTIVADPYGALYHKEAAVQALLARKQQKQEEAALSSSSSLLTETMLGLQVRRLADLYDVRFHRESNVSTCPITGKALTGSIPAILLLPGKEATPNVVSESALKQLSTQELEEEYGPIQKTLRLAPPPTLLESVKEQVQAEQEKEEAERKMKKAEKSKKKKRKRGENGADGKRDKASDKKHILSAIVSKDSTKGAKKSTSSSKPALGDAVQSHVNSAIQQSSVLSSLFTTTNKTISEKEKKDNLFAR
ncbi:MAG: hypothetical protein SGILL_006955 [Bacillariaceae sp.]